MEDIHFKIIVPFYNVEEWIRKCVLSVKFQDYKNFQCVLIDDMSTDNSVEKIKKITKGDNRFVLIENKEKKFALRNIYDGILESSPSDEDVIITLDGDDWLASKSTLSKLNSIYNKEDCWITYGSYVEYPARTTGKFSRQIPKQVIKNRLLRRYEWCSSHLRTFKYGLWSKIKKEDLLDRDGNFYKMAWDLSFMFPMLEMAGNRSYYVDDILYVYNLSNPLNDHKQNEVLQRTLEIEIRSKPTYPSLEVNKNRSEWLLNHKRFDIASKILFAKHFLKGSKSEFPKETYLENLKVWNNFKESQPKKTTADDFLNSFKELITSISNEGFKAGNEVPIINNSPINGAHRVATAISLNKDTLTREGDPHEGQYLCDYKYFKNKKDFVDSGLREVYLDEMALEFCRQKNNLHCICLFPSHNKNIEDLLKIIERKHGIVYAKKIGLTEKGKINFVSNLYLGEAWAGNKNNGLPGIREKSQLCFLQGNEVTVVLVEEDDLSELNVLKDSIRKHCNVGKHSVHINDTQEETWRIASTVFNNNSVHFINNRDPFAKTVAFDSFFDRYKNILPKNGMEDFCIDSSAVISAYGLRDCRDLDYIHFSGLNMGQNGIDCHNSELHHYTKTKDEILFNPRNHFYFSGYKFASIETVMDMKIKRNEEKDKVDVELIKRVV